MESSDSTPQPSTELSAAPETELPSPIEASPADGVDRPRGAVRTFHDEVLAYFLSQMWYDLIFVHVLRLRPRPFCEWWHLTQVLGQARALALAPALASASASASSCLTLARAEGCPEVDTEEEAILLKHVLQKCADGEQIIKCRTREVGRDATSAWWASAPTSRPCTCYVHDAHMRTCHAHGMQMARTCHTGPSCPCCCCSSESSRCGGCDARWRRGTHTPPRPCARCWACRSAGLLATCASTSSSTTTRPCSGRAAWAARAAGCSSLASGAAPPSSPCASCCAGVPQVTVADRTSAEGHHHHAITRHHAPPRTTTPPRVTTRHQHATLSAPWLRCPSPPAVLFTLISACIITVSLACSNGDPWGRHRSTGAARRGLAALGAGRCPPWAWELLCALGRLFRAALGTMIMVLWNEVLSRTVTSSLREEPIISLSQLRGLNASYAELCAARPNATCGAQSSSDLLASAESFKRIQVHTRWISPLTHVHTLYACAREDDCGAPGVPYPG